MSHTIKDPINVRFLGGAGTVTGSKYLVQYKGKNILIDCGLFQGLKELRLLNWDSFPINPAEIDCVLLTHAHLDHTGYLPHLSKKGFQGQIYCTAPTKDLAEIILYDSAKIQEEEAREANEKEYSKHKPAKPLYIERDVTNCLRQFKCIEPLVKVNLESSISARFTPNGHILGSCAIELHLGEHSILFSGDIGPCNDPILPDFVAANGCDYVFIESTYGNKLHAHPDIIENLSQILKEAQDQQKILIIPSFAVERTQILLYYIYHVMHANKDLKIPIYLDSPMGIKVLQSFITHHHWTNISPKDWEMVLKDVNIIEDFHVSSDMMSKEFSRVVIAGSGMSTGGRVLGYYEQLISKDNVDILIVGYQAEGTRGRQLLEGSSTIKLKGQIHKVKAKIIELEGLSAHADQAGLIAWLKALNKKPYRVFIVHGEADGAQGLSSAIQSQLGWDSYIPQLGEEVELGYNKMGNG